LNRVVNEISHRKNGDKVSAFRELIETLENMLQLYKALYGVALKKKDQIIHNKIDELNVSQSQESKLLKQLAEFEPIARVAMVKLQREQGVRPKLKITLTEIGKMTYNPADRKELSGLREAMGSVLNDLRTSNELNQQLLQQAMEYNSFSLDVLFGAPDEEVVYKKPTMQPQGLKRPGMFDVRR
jgi:flagellar biosynthesis/type III secretory pathway chaperone